jgi:hypothetical protein
MNLFIEVETPSAITLPAMVQDVIVVNNTLPQPTGYGLNAPSGKNPDNDSAYVKTLKRASWQVIAETFKYLDNSKKFSNVSYYKKPIREDDEWLAVVPPKEDIKRDFFENENFDLLISIDRLLFNTKNQPDKSELGKITALLTFSAYLRNKEKPVAHLTIADSVTVSYSVDYFDDVVPYVNYEELVTVMIHYSTGRLGEKLGKLFVSSWNTAERLYFIRNFSEANKMVNYINKGKWDEAKTSWTNEFELTKKSVDKAKLATNIALACEMNDKFNEAEVWAKEAKTHFQTVSSKKYSKEINYLNEYIKTLLEREKNSMKTAIEDKFER